MLDFDKNKLPNYFNDYFCKTLQVHTGFTHSAKKQLVYLPRYRTNHLRRSIKFREVIIWYNLPNFLKNSSYLKIRYLYKRQILESYEQS